MRNDVVKERIAEALPMYRGVMKKAFEGKASPRGAIKAQCLICVGYERAAITACTGFSCPLWEYRPYQVGEDSEIDAEGSEI
jgi:hypothetical protein